MPLRLARNRILQEFRSHGLAQARVMCMMDMDGELLDSIPTPAHVRRVLTEAPRDWMALTAQTPVYYDFWALRSSWCPSDFWLDMDDGQRQAVVAHPIPAGPTRVRSAFNGFALYDAAAVAASGARYLGWQHGRRVCEHVPFHEMLQTAFPDRGIYIIPQLRLGRQGE